MISRLYGIFYNRFLHFKTVYPIPIEIILINNIIQNISGYVPHGTITFIPKNQAITAIKPVPTVTTVRREIVLLVWRSINEL